MQFLGAVGSLLGGLFGGSDSDQSFEKHSTTTTNASSTDLAPELLASLKNLFQGTLGSGQFENAGSALTSRLNQLTAETKRPQFDVAGFAKSVTDQATAGANLDLESSINGILSKSGTTESGNSMNALLANKLRNTTAANLAGINAQATATGEGIRSSQENTLTQGIQNLGATLSQQILQLIQGTRGAEAQGTSTSKEDTFGHGTDSQSQNPIGAIGNAFASLSKARLSA